MSNLELLSTAAAARELGINRSTLTRWIKSGKARPHKVSDTSTGAYVFDRPEIDRLKSQNGAAA